MIHITPRMTGREFLSRLFIDKLKQGTDGSEFKLRGCSPICSSSVATPHSGSVYLTLCRRRNDGLIFVLGQPNKGSSERPVAIGVLNLLSDDIESEAGDVIKFLRS